jgi:hypothetical protein
MRGRWAEVRHPNPQELKATLVLAIPLVEVSAKLRTGGPIDDEEDLSIPAWAGVLPLHLSAAEPVPDTLLPGEMHVPDYITRYCRGSGGC